MLINLHVDVSPKPLPLYTTGSSKSQSQTTALAHRQSAALPQALAA